MFKPSATVLMESGLAVAIGQDDEGRVSSVSGMESENHSPIETRHESMGFPTSISGSEDRYDVETR
jgi:hypothetical protein